MLQKPLTRRVSCWLVILPIAALNVDAVAQTAPPRAPQTAPPTVETLRWYTPDADFKPVEPAPWVYEGVQKVFIGDFANPATMPYIDELAEMGVTVIHTGGPDPYFPLRRDGGAGPAPKERDLLLSAFDQIRKRGMRIVIGVSPYAPSEFVKRHPDWRLMSAPDENSPYGDYLIENAAEIFKDFQVDGISFDGNYHPAINYTPYDIELFRKETGREFPAKIDLSDDNYKIYMLWADTKLENWYRRLHPAVVTSAVRHADAYTRPRLTASRRRLRLVGSRHFRGNSRRRLRLAVKRTPGLCEPPLWKPAANCQEPIRGMSGGLLSWHKLNKCCCSSFFRELLPRWTVVMDRQLDNQKRPRSRSERFLTDEELLVGYRASGDRVFFAQLVRRYERELFNYLRRYLGNAEMAEDAFQATFLQVHLKCHQFEQDRRVRPWLYTIATNQAIDAQRRHKRQSTISLDRSGVTSDEAGSLLDLLVSDSLDPFDEASGIERARWVHAALADLSEQLRRVVDLVYYQGLKYREAAEVLDIPVGTVKSRLHAAIARLTEIWDHSHIKN